MWWWWWLLLLLLLLLANKPFFLPNDVSSVHPVSVLQVMWAQDIYFEVHDRQQHIVKHKDILLDSKPTCT